MLNTLSSAKKVKICYIVPSYDSGTGSHFFYLYELLERASSTLDIFVVAEKGVAPSQKPPFGFYLQRFARQPLRGLELFFVLCCKRFAGYKFFYAHYSFGGAVFSRAVTCIFGGLNFYWNCGMPWLYKRGRFEEALFRFALKHSVFVTGTAGIRDAYQSRYGLKEEDTRVMPNWIDVRRFADKTGREELRRHFGIAEGGKVVLFVHRLSRRKGSHQILPVAGRVAKSVPDVIFLIIGLGPEEESLELEIRNWKLENYVRMIGEISNKNIPEYFHAADVFFMPSEEEGFPHVLLEAQASGTPYVASDVGGVKEITPPELSDCVVDPLDTELFAECIIGLLGRGQLEIESIGNAEKKWVMKYDIEVALPKFISLFVQK
ncbi:MAG: glycosyltransferase family 4 protein [bacterium]|nr:glycosyltransferase family 4 protein [bacterium]